MARIVHTADLHFDTPYSARLNSMQAELRRSELKSTFSAIVDKAKEADVFIIAGDLFDGKLVSQDTIDFLKRKFGELSHVPVFITAGNHDPYTADSVYAREDFGDNVHIFGGDMEYVDLEELKLRIHGVSFKAEAVESSQLTTLELSEDFANILVMHGDVNPIGDSRYNPLTEDALCNCGAEYVALGHIHTYSGVHAKEGKCSWAYPGNPEGRGFDETGDKGILIGTVEKGMASLEFLKMSKRRYFDLCLDVSDAKDEAQIYEMIENCLATTGSREDFYRITLEGRTNIISEYVLDVLKEKAGELAFYVDIVDKTESAYDYVSMASEPSLRGRFVSMMLERAKNADAEERETIYLAMKIGVDALS